MKLYVLSPQTCATHNANLKHARLTRQVIQHGVPYVLSYVEVGILHETQVIPLVPLFGLVSISNQCMITCDSISDIGV